MKSYGDREREIQEYIKQASIKFFLGDEVTAKKLLRKALKKINK